MMLSSPLRTPRLRSLSLMLAVTLAAGLVPATAVAQSRENITVILIDTVGFNDDDLFELRYGIEQIVRDYDEFDLVDEFELRDRLSSSELRELDSCWAEMNCFIDALTGTSIDNLLVVEAAPTDDGYTAYITSVDLTDGQVVAEQEGFFPEPGDSLFLLAPIYETLEPLSGPSEEPPVTTTEPERRTPQPWLPPVEEKTERNILSTSLMAGGGAMLLVGITFYILADGTQEDIQREPHDRAELADLQSTGQTQQTVGNVMVIAGAVVLAAGIVFELTGIGAPKDDFDFDDEDWVRLNFGIPGGSPYVGLEVNF